MTSSSGHSPDGRNVFLSYSHHDKDTAEKVAAALQSGGLNPWFDEWEVRSGEAFEARLDRALGASSVVVVLLSARSVESAWLRTEVEQAIARAMTVVPTVISRCEIPYLLRRFHQIDLTEEFEGGLRRLVSGVAAATDVVFERLTEHEFEALVAALLRDCGFRIEAEALRGDKRFDLIGEYDTQDPFGVPRTERWVIEVKLHRKQRVSVEVVRDLASYLSTSGPQYRGLIVTSGTLTSVAAEYLKTLETRIGRPIRVLDGPELTNLLAQRPELVHAHFPRSAGT